MPKLKELWRRDLPTQPPLSFPCLSQLDIRYCDDLASLELHSSLLLSKLEISHYPKITSLLLLPSPLLSQLDIKFWYELTSLELHSSHFLSNLQICECPPLVNILTPTSISSSFYFKDLILW